MIKRWSPKKTEHWLCEVEVIDALDIRWWKDEVIFSIPVFTTDIIAKKIGVDLGKLGF